MDRHILSILVCPNCQARLSHDKKNNTLNCGFEQLAYPIEDGIPKLMIEHAVHLDKASNVSKQPSGRSGTQRDKS